MNIEELERVLGRPDRLDWRITYDDDVEEWYAWFHPDWAADPIKVVLGDKDLSDNEKACIEALQAIIAHAPALLRVVRAAREYEAALAAVEIAAIEAGVSPDDGSALALIEDAARASLRAALTALEAAP